MKPPSYADLHQRQAFAQWLEAERLRTGTPKVALAQEFDEEGTTRINRILSGKLLPLPDTLRRICAVMGVPWFEAFAMAGYYKPILQLLASLVTLGAEWAEQDGAHPLLGDTDFRFTGVLKIGNEYIGQALTNERLSSRYIVGSYNFDGEIHRTVVPKPLGIALLVAAAGFPRRGDVYKDGISSYAAEALSAATGIIQLLDGRSETSLPPLLVCADELLRNNSVPFGVRRVASSEYVTQWCDDVCNPFTHFARLAAFARWGEAGSSVSTVTPFTMLPQIRIAETPALRDLSI
jgi:hypothetical protein